MYVGYVKVKMMDYLLWYTILHSLKNDWEENSVGKM